MTVPAPLAAHSLRLRVRSIPAFVFLAFGFIAFLPAPARAQLGMIEMAGVRLVYFDGTESYLVPHAARTFLNSLAFQRAAVRLHADGSRSRSCWSISRTPAMRARPPCRDDAVIVQIAPLSFAFETIAGNERMNIIMNHELVHVATMDQAARPDRLFRRLFGGKVTPVAGAARIDALFLPDRRRAWQRRAGTTRASRVFIDTWMAGGLGRAQSGYDEMVFRSMVRDGAPLLRSAGPRLRRHARSTSSCEVNSYLYGTRFMTWLARTLFAREGGRVGRAPRRQPRLLRVAVPARVRHAARTGVGRVDRGRARVPAAAISTPMRAVSAHARTAT